jgi:[protein-PII] uridylyltransferase
VLELVAEDAPGLLYRVSRVISDQGIDVDLVLISTEGQKAIDVFHITRGGAKLSEAEQASLKSHLERMLQEELPQHNKETAQ